MAALLVGFRRFLYRLGLSLSQLAAALSHEAKLHPARFARLHELTALLAPTVQIETSLLSGVGPLRHMLRVQPTPKRRELGNLLVCAPIRGGKGLLAVSQLLTWNQSAIVNDIKGELYAQTAGFRARLGKVFVVDPDGTGHRYDPLASKKTEDALLSAATQLLFDPEEGEGKIFTQRAALMLTQLFLAARQEGYAPLLYAKHLIDEGLLASAATLDAVSPALATRFLDATFADADLSDHFLLSAWSTLSARLYPLLTQSVVRALSGADFTAREIMTAPRPTTVYLRWPEIDLLTLAPLVRLLWDSLLGELITTFDKASGRNCRPVLCLMDEAGRTAIPSLSEHATTVVGRGISLWVAVQSLSQLDAIYGKHRADTLRNNFDTQIYYRQASLETAQYVARCLGRRSDYAHSHTLRDGTPESQALSEQAVPLLTPREIMQMRDEDILCFHRRLPPVSATRMDWREFPLLAQRRALPPPPLSLRRAQERDPQTIWEGSWEKNASYLDPDERN